MRLLDIQTLATLSNVSTGFKKRAYSPRHAPRVIKMRARYDEIHGGPLFDSLVNQKRITIQNVDVLIMSEITETSSFWEWVKAKEKTFLMNVLTRHDDIYSVIMFAREASYHFADP